MTQISNFALHIQMSRNEFYVEIFENLWVNIKMYMIKVSKSKISDLKSQKMIILWTLKHNYKWTPCLTVHVWHGSELSIFWLCFYCNIFITYVSLISTSYQSILVVLDWRIENFLVFRVAGKSVFLWIE